MHFAVRSRLFGTIEALGRPGEDVPIFGQALPELLQSNDTVRAADLTMVRPYNPEFVGVVKAGHHAVDLEPLLPETARRRLLDTARTLRDDADLKEDLLSAPLYSDPAPRRYDVLLDLALSLHSWGLLVFRMRRAGQVGVFTAAKKDGKLSLIFDSRLVNELCLDPSKVQLASPGALRHVRLPVAPLDNGGKPTDHTRDSSSPLVLSIASTCSSSTPTAIAS